MDFNLKGKTAIVTGGGSGLGAAICEVFAQEGANSVINYIVDEGKAFKYADYLNEKYGTICIPMYGDITNARDIESIIAEPMTCMEE